MALLIRNPCCQHEDRTVNVTPTGLPYHMRWWCDACGSEGSYDNGELVVEKWTYAK